MIWIAFSSIHSKIQFGDPGASAAESDRTNQSARNEWTWGKLASHCLKTVPFLAVVLWRKKFCLFVAKDEEKTILNCSTPVRIFAQPNY